MLLSKTTLKTIAKPAIQKIVIVHPLYLCSINILMQVTVLLKPILKSFLTSREGTGKADSLIDFTGKVTFDVGSVFGSYKQVI